MKPGFGKIKEKTNQMLGGVKGAFSGRKKDHNDTYMGDKQMAANVRETSEKLKNKLLSISFSQVGEGISKEQLQDVQKRIQVLTQMLDRAPTSVLDTRAMDKKTYHCADRLAGAVRDGNSKTVDHIMKALAYGIYRGHAPLTAGTDSKAELSKREERLEKYLKIVESCEKIDGLQNDIRKHEEIEASSRARFEVLKQEIEQELKVSPEIILELREYGQSYSRLTPQAHMVAVKKDGAAKVYQTIESAQNVIGNLHREINGYQTSIDQIQLSLARISEKMDEELVKYTDRIQSEWINDLYDTDKRIEAMDKISRKISDALDEYFSSRRMVEYIYKVEERYNQIIQSNLQKETQRQAAALQMEKERQEQPLQENDIEQENELENQWMDNDAENFNF